MIVDAHVHVGAWDHADFMGREVDLDTALSVLAGAGIGGVALLPSDRCENAELLTAARRALAGGFRGSLWFFPWVRPVGRGGPGERDVGFVRANLWDVSGVKIHPSLSRVRVTDDGFRPFLDLAESERLVVIVHCGRWSEIAGYAHALDAAARHPRARFVLAHSGGDTPPLATGAARDAAKRGLDNVWFDLASLREYWVTERNVRAYGASRYLFASDFPLGHPAMYLGAVNGMALTDGERRQILGENAAALFGEPLRSR